MAENKGGYWTDYKKYHATLAEMKKLNAKTEDERNHWDNYKKHHSSIADLHELGKRVYGKQNQEIANARVGE